MVVLAVAVVVALGMMGRLSDLPTRLDVAMVLIVPCLAFVALLDELSFGMRIFGFEPPVIEGANLASVHDLVLIGALFIHHHLPLLVAAVLLLAIAAVGGIAIVLLYRAGFFAGIIDQPFFRPLATAAVIAVIAIVIDLDLIAIPDHQLWEELLELSAAVFLVASGVALGQTFEGVSGRSATSEPPVSTTR